MAATPFELLAAYVSIAERGTSQVLRQMTTLRRAVVAATSTARPIVVSTNLSTITQEAARATRQMQQLQAAARAATTQTALIASSGRAFSQAMGPAVQSAASITGHLNSARLAAQAASGQMGQFTASIVAGSAALTGLVTLMASGFPEAVSRERSQFAFEALTGSADEAIGLMRELKQLSDSTAIDFPGLRESAQRLLAMGTSSDVLLDTLETLANIAAASNTQLNGLALVYSQVQSKGQLYREEVLQLGERGIPIMQALSEVLGENQRAVNDLITAGAVGFPEFRRAIDSLGGAGGRFDGLARELAGGLAGEVQKAINAWRDLGVEVATFSAGAVNDIRGVISFTQELTSVLTDAGKVVFGDNFQLQTLFGALQDIIDFNKELDELNANRANALTGAALEAARVAAAEERAAKAAEEAATAAEEFTTLLRSLEDTALEDALKVEADRIIDADKLRDSLLSPLGEFRQELERISSLFTFGNIDEDIYSRAISKANADFEELLDKKDRFERRAPTTLFNVASGELVKFEIQDSRNAEIDRRDARRRTAIAERSAQLLEEINRKVGQPAATVRPEVTEQDFNNSDLF